MPRRQSTGQRGLAVASGSMSAAEPMPQRMPRRTLFDGPDGLIIAVIGRRMCAAAARASGRMRMGVAGGSSARKSEEARLLHPGNLAGATVCDFVVVQMLGLGGSVPLHLAVPN